MSEIKPEKYVLCYQQVEKLQTQSGDESGNLHYLLIKDKNKSYLRKKKKIVLVVTKVDVLRRSARRTSLLIFYFYFFLNLSRSSIKIVDTSFPSSLRGTLLFVIP